MSRKRYRKIWEIANGPIPKDNLGRTYEIHHIDGDETNDVLSNLQALPSNRQTNFSKNNPTLIKVTCEHCSTIVGMGNYVQWHGENCKEIKYVVR